MKKSENLMQKLFGSFAVGNSRVPLRSNVFSKGYCKQQCDFRY